MSLARLLEQATPGPWEAAGPSSFHTAELRAPSPYNGFALIKVMTNRDADLGLIALAPDMAQLLIDMAEWVGEIVAAMETNSERGAPDEAFALLARFAELNARAGADGA